jgi:caffeoyl-CoA O-methyltransferase
MGCKTGVLTSVLVIAMASIALAQPPGGNRGPGRGRPGGPGGPGVTGGGLDTATVPKDEVEKKLLTVIDDITRKQGWRLNVPVQDGRMLRLLAESIGAKTAVEVGTSNGISTIWLAMGMQKTGGKVITHEIDPETAKLAHANFKAAGVADMITVVVGDAHEKVADLKGPIDMVFIDADKEGYTDYLKKVLPIVRPGGLICAHNITSRQANPAYFKAATTNPDLETIVYTGAGGLSISLKKR